MKKSIVGSLIGIGIVLSFDSLSRIIIALYMKEDILMLSYSNYPGMLWPILLVVIAGFGTFFGAMFSLTYGRRNYVTSMILFTTLVILLRYSQIHVLYETEALLFPLLSLVLSLVALFLAWKALHKPKRPDAEFEVDKKEKEVKEEMLRNEVNRPH